MKKKFIYIITLILFLGSFSSKAQEALTGLQINPKIKELYSNKSKVKSAQEKAPVEIPFIDDFAKSIGFPDSSLWEDENVFINQTYAYNPISIGVATFDAIDGTGAMYSNASSYPFGADTLTSKPINLNYPGNNTIFLSFYYQPGGLGDTPEAKDSLILEYYSAATDHWNKIWNVVFDAYDSVLIEKHSYDGDSTKMIYGDTLTNLRYTFQRVIVPVNENQYLNSNFQFRFRNYASLSVSTNNESVASNSDHWNLDYLILDKDRNFNDTIFDDNAFCKPIGSFLKTYESIPWAHFYRAIAYEIVDSIQVTYRNLFNNPRDPAKYFEIEDIMGAAGTTYLEGGIYPGAGIGYMETRTYKRVNDFVFPYNPSEDSALFEIRAIFDVDNPETNDIPFRWNDTTRFMQKFYNYYAYDDGSAENGYGIIGEGTERAMVAMKFRTYKKDTLRGVQIYFNQVLNDANQYPFKLHIWSNSDGKPGNIIYTQEGLKPQNADELNKFTTFKLDSAIVLDGYFFVGWQKESTSEMLNVGFDVNKINNDKLYYNFAGDWVQSQFEGTIMIRPVFGKELNIATGTNTTPHDYSLKYNIYPNPANNLLNINLDNQSLTDFRYTVFDIFGKVYIDKTSQESAVDISNLNSGIYFIRISNSKGASTTKKFIVVH